MKYEENVHVYLVKADTFAKGQKIKLIWIRFRHGYILTPSMQLQAMPTSAAERFVPERTNKQTNMHRYCNWSRSRSGRNLLGNMNLTITC